MRPTILVADDDSAILEVMTIVLEGEGHDVVIAKDEEEIFVRLNDSLPRLILLDIGLGGSDGREVTKRLKSAEYTRQIPVVISSANSDTAKIADEIGADGFLSKPFEIDELLRIVNTHISS